ATLLGSHWDEAARRLPTHPRIRLPLWRRQPQGRNLRLSDHAGARYGMLSDFPEDIGQEVPPAAHSAVRRRSRQSPQRRTRSPQQHHTASAPTLFSRAEPSGKSVGRDSRKNLQELRSQIHGGRLRQACGGGTLHRTQSRDREIHHVFPLHCQVNLMWKWYYILAIAARHIPGALRGADLRSFLRQRPGARRLRPCHPDRVHRRFPPPFFLARALPQPAEFVLAPVPPEPARRPQPTSPPPLRSRPS